MCSNALAISIVIAHHTTRRPAGTISTPTEYAKPTISPKYSLAEVVGLNAEYAAAVENIRLSECDAAAELSEDIQARPGEDKLHI